MNLRRIAGANAQRFRDINSHCLKRMTNDCSSLVDHPMDIDLVHLGGVDADDLLADSLPSLVLVKFELEGTDRPQTFFMLVDLLAAAGLSRLLRRMPMADLAERRRRINFDADDLDGFIEIVNVLRGALNLAVNNQTGAEYQVNQISLEVINSSDPSKDLKPFLSEKSYVLAKSDLHIKGLDETILYLLWSSDIVESILGEDPVNLRTVILLQDGDSNLPFDSKGIINLLSYQFDRQKYGPTRDFILQHKEVCAIMVTNPNALADFIEMCRDLRADSWIRHLSVIAMLQYPTKDSVMAAIEAGADDIIALPTTPEFINQRLEHLTDGSKAA